MEPARAHRLCLPLPFQQQLLVDLRAAARDVAPLAVGVLDEGLLVGRVGVTLTEAERPVRHLGHQDVREGRLLEARAVVRLYLRRAGVVPALLDGLGSWSSSYPRKQFFGNSPPCQGHNIYSYCTNHRQPAGQPAACNLNLRSHDSAAEFSRSCVERRSNSGWRRGCWRSRSCY
eukprot:COSAG01_NODE_24503_length_776_cov_3.577548_1_plen_173_part_01